MTTLKSTGGSWTSADLEPLPDNGVRYAIVDGELFIAKMPHFRYQETCAKFAMVLTQWTEATGLGRVSINPGVLFTPLLPDYTCPVARLFS
jgi:hypothetical protein